MRKEMLYQGRISPIKVVRVETLNRCLAVTIGSLGEDQRVKVYLGSTIRVFKYQELARDQLQGLRSHQPRCRILCQQLHHSPIPSCLSNRPWILYNHYRNNPVNPLQLTLERKRIKSLNLKSGMAVRLSDSKVSIKIWSLEIIWR